MMIQVIGSDQPDYSAETIRDFPPNELDDMLLQGLIF
jgi:hypothetical protein